MTLARSARQDSATRTERESSKTATPRGSGGIHRPKPPAGTCYVPQRNRAHRNKVEAEHFLVAHEHRDVEMQSVSEELGEQQRRAVRSISSNGIELIRRTPARSRERPRHLRQGARSRKRKYFPLVPSGRGLTVSLQAVKEIQIKGLMALVLLNLCINFYLWL